MSTDFPTILNREAEARRRALAHAAVGRPVPLNILRELAASEERTREARLEQIRTREPRA